MTQKYDDAMRVFAQLVRSSDAIYEDRLEYAIDDFVGYGLSYEDAKRVQAMLHAHAGLIDRYTPFGEQEGRSVDIETCAAQHTHEAESKHATFYNFGWAITDTGMASKTDKGVLETEFVDGKYVHTWSE